MATIDHSEKMPNAITQAAIDEVLNDRGELPRYEDLESMLKDIREQRDN